MAEHLPERFAALSAALRRVDQPGFPARVVCAPRWSCGYHIRMPGGTRRGIRLVQGCLLLVSLHSNACSPARPSLALNDGTVIVENQTTHEWRNIVVTVNDHFRAGAATLAPGGRLTAPLSQFQTAFGQHFDRGRQRVAKIELKATDDGGKPVSLEWAGARSN